MWKGTFGWDKYVEIVTWTMCNANCYFCFERNTPELDEIYEEYKQIKKTMIQWSNEWIKDISFSGWEITIYKQFFKLLELTRELWYENIVITTNWFKMSDESYANHVLSYLNKIELSTHTIDYKLGDEIFWKKWAWKKNIEALLNILKYQKNINPSLDFTIFTTLLKKNSSDILKTLDFFVKVWVKKVVLLYSIWWTDSYNIVKVSKLVEFIEKKYKWILDLRYSYIQPCVFSEEFLENWGWEKCFLNQERKEVLSNDPEWVTYFDNILFWNNIVTTDKCKKCKYYKKNCYWFWKKIYETGWYNSMNEM